MYRPIIVGNERERGTFVILYNGYSSGTPVYAVHINFQVQSNPQYCPSINPLPERKKTAAHFQGPNRFFRLPNIAHCCAVNKTSLLQLAKFMKEEMWKIFSTDPVSHFGIILLMWRGAIGNWSLFCMYGTVLLHVEQCLCTCRIPIFCCYYMCPGTIHAASRKNKVQRCFCFPASLLSDGEREWHTIRD